MFTIHPTPSTHLFRSCCQTKMMTRFLCFLSLFVSLCYGQPPKPSADILAWTKREIGMMYTYDIQVTLSNGQDYNFCSFSDIKVPSPSEFNPQQIDTENWLDAAEAIGAKYAVLVVKHCSGFVMWPTDIEAETGFDYQFSIKNSPLQGGQYDLVNEFVNSCRKRNILPGIYYSLNNNYYLNVKDGSVRNDKLMPGQANITFDLYQKIVLAQLKELWSNYGSLSEIWFDGGCTLNGIGELLQELQSNAVYFQGYDCIPQNNIRWIGTESGLPAYPVWSNADKCQHGPGSGSGGVFCPAETDTTLQVGDNWFWINGTGIRTLDELKTVYVSSVGHNTNLLLNAAPNAVGLIDESKIERYKEFGQWISDCFGTPVLSTSGQGKIIKLATPAGQPFQYNKIIIQEDQTNGEAVTEFSIYNPFLKGRIDPIWSGQSIGHKLIINMTSGELQAHELILNITGSMIEPVITHFGVYYCPGS